MAHPAITFAAAFGLPHPMVGEEVAAAIVCRGVPLDVRELQDWMREQVASYKVPSRVLMVNEGELPLLASGKPDRVKLASMVAQMTESPLGT
jgi:oxalate---CoA ligase